MNPLALSKAHNTKEENIWGEKKKPESAPDAIQLNWTVPSVYKKILTHNYPNKSIHLEAQRALNQSTYLFRSLKLFLLLSKFYTPRNASNTHQQDCYQKLRLFLQSTHSFIQLSWVWCIAAAIWVTTVYHILEESRKVEQKGLAQSMSSELDFPAAFVWLNTKHSMTKKILLNIQDHLIPPFVYWVD